MFFKRYFILALALAFSFCIKAHCGQKIKDFYLANYTQEGVQEWELKGDIAVVCDKYVDIDKMDATYFSSEDTIRVKSHIGWFGSDRE